MYGPYSDDLKGSNIDPEADNLRNPHMLNRPSAMLVYSAAKTFNQMESNCDSGRSALCPVLHENEASVLRPVNYSFKRGDWDKPWNAASGGT